MASIADTVRAQALVPVGSSSEAVPALEPLPTSSTALVTTEAPQRGFWASWFDKTPPTPVDPNIVEANRAFAQSALLLETLKDVHRRLPNNSYLLQLAPHRWEELFTPYDAARASAIAILAGLKTRLDTAALAGATAALSAPSRARFAEAVTNIQSADAECSSLRTAAQTRHAEAKDEAERATRAAAEVEKKRATFRDDLKDISGARRASIEDRLAKLALIGYRFAVYAFDDPAKPATGDCAALAPLAVLPTLADKQRLVFNKLDPYGRLPHADARPISSGAEVEDIVDALMGRGPSD
ncbi:MAG: hypothetical protein ACAI38_23840 [Myxococcota bacterium]|nr:hypothetical protein [Myxococcota bacterium]